MSWLIDTHIYLWFSGALNEAQLKPAVRTELENKRNSIYISIANLWEMKIKQQEGLFK